MGQVLKAKKPSVKMIALEPEDTPVLSGGRAGPAQDSGHRRGLCARHPGPQGDRRSHHHLQRDGAGDGAAAARLEGIPVGISSGAAIAAALEVGARPENAGKTIVAIIPSFAERYLSTALFEGL